MGDRGVASEWAVGPRRAILGISLVMSLSCRNMDSILEPRDRFNRCSRNSQKSPRMAHERRQVQPGFRPDFAVTGCRKLVSGSLYQQRLVRLGRRRSYCQ
jgi:hypothetical protein